MPRMAELEGDRAGNRREAKAGGHHQRRRTAEELRHGKGPAEIVARTRLKENDLLTGANHAEPFRVKGIGSEYSQPLEAAGVDSATEPATRKADNLVKKMEVVNMQKKLVRRTPT